MARSGSNENKEANQTFKQQGQTAFQGGQAAIKNYNAGESTLEAGGSVGANPFKSADYLGNENKLQSESLNTANDAAKAQMNQFNLSTGGLNSSATPLAIRDASLQKGRLADQLTAERAANDFRSNLSWQQQLLQNRLQPAGAESPYYGTAVGGRNSSLGNLSQLGVAAYSPWNAAIAAAGGVASKATPTACWIAAELFGGWMEPRTKLVRRWIAEHAPQSRLGRILADLYSRYGERTARVVHRSRMVRGFFQPMFNLMLKRALAEYGEVA